MWISGLDRPSNLLYSRGMAETKERAQARIYVYPKDAAKLKHLSADQVGVIPADIIHELLQKK